MQGKRALLVVVVLLAVAAIASARTWKDRNGKSMQAEFVRMQGRTVLLKVGGVRIVRIAFDELSDGDQSFLREELERRGEGDQIPASRASAKGHTRDETDKRNADQPPARAAGPVGNGAGASAGGGVSTRPPFGGASAGPRFSGGAAGPTGRAPRPRQPTAVAPQAAIGPGLDGSSVVPDPGFRPAARESTIGAGPAPQDPMAGLSVDRVPPPAPSAARPGPGASAGGYSGTPPLLGYQMVYKCSKCSREVPRTTKVCPGCGAHFGENTKPNWWTGVGVRKPDPEKLGEAIGTLLGALIGVFIIFRFTRKRKS